MMRLLMLMIGVFSSVLVGAEVAGLAYLWSTGALKSENLAAIRSTLAGVKSDNDDSPSEGTEVQAVSADQIEKQRVVRVFDLEARENELGLLKRMTADTANQLISDRQAFDQLKDEFRRELERLRTENASAATEQTRAVLQSTPPEAAVRRLTGLTLPEAIGLLRGMPEKTIAKVLQAFQQDPQAAQRGQELFEALYRGDPQRGIIDKALQPLGTTRPASATPPEG